MSGSTRETRLWAHLHRTGPAAGELPTQADTPWYLAVLTGIAAWVAAVFAFLFVIESFDRMWSEPWRALAAGAVCAVAALGLLRWARGRVFQEQLGLATSLAGQSLMGLGLVQGTERAFESGMAWLPWCGIAAIALAMHALGRLPLHRFLCGGIFAAGVLGACIADAQASRVVAAPLLAWLALVAWWRSEANDRFAPGLSPLAWALSMMALLAVGFVDLDNWRFERYGASAAWLRPLGDALMLPLLPACTAWLLRRQARVALRTRVALVALSWLLALACWRAPGVTLATTLALIGFALHRPMLLIVGTCGIGGYLLRYYFQLDTTLLEKSGWLLAAGAVLLLARFVARRGLHAEAPPPGEAP